MARRIRGRSVAAVAVVAEARGGGFVVGAC